MRPWSHTGTVPPVSAPEHDPVEPDWYPDPTGRNEFRYHNGVSWTGDVATDGRRGVDPVTGPTSPPGRGPDRSARPGLADGPPNGAAVASMTCGIIAVALGWIPVLFVVGAVLAVLAVVFGTNGLRRSREGARGRTMAIAGLATGVAGLLVAIGGLVFTIALVRALDRYENPPDHTVELTACSIASDVVEVSGTLRNDSTARAEFTVAVPLVRGASGARITTIRDGVGPLAPGATAEWSVRRPVVLDADLASGAECRDPEVNGPLPFGVVPPG